MPLQSSKIVPTMISRIRVAMVSLAACAALAWPAVASAGEPPFNEAEISISARGQDVRDFVADLFSEAGLRAKVSTGVKGKVQGVFRDPPKVIWGTISRAYGLVAYWDGSVVRVYSNEEVSSRSIPTFAGERITAQAQRLGLIDEVNTVRPGDGLVLATGVPEFLDRLERMAGQLQTQALSARQAPTVQPLPETTRTVASPLLRAPLARASVRSEVIRQAGRRSPFEVRIFYLKYRSAADRQSRNGDLLSIIPGVATLLQEQMGDGRQVGGVTSNAPNEFPDSGLRSVRNRSHSDGRFGDRFDDKERYERELDLNGPRISADSTVNAVIVRDRPETMGVYEKLIANLDIEPLVVETQVTILELNRTKLKELGLDFGFGLESLGVLFGGGPNFGPGGITGGYLSGDGEIFLLRAKALQERGAVRVVTRQTLSSLNNEVASFGDTTRQVVKLEGEREVDAVEVDYGLAMRVRPSAIEDGGEMRIRMQIEIDDTQLNGLVVDGVPVTGGANLATHMIVRQGESVMLGGMTRNTVYDRKRKTPILGDIPLLGQAFRKRKKGEDHYERLFLLTPRISNLGTTQLAASEVESLSMEQLRGEEPVRRKRR